MLTKEQKVRSHNMLKKRRQLLLQVGNEIERETSTNELLNILIDYVINNNNDAKKFLENYKEKSKITKDKDKLLTNLIKKSEILSGN